MNINLMWIFLALLMSNCSTKGQSTIQVNIPTVEEETDYIWRNIQDIAFFRKNNYDLRLPEGEFMNELIAKVESNKLVDQDYNDLLQFMKKNAYQKSDYQSGCDKINDQKELLEQLINRIGDHKFEWNFKRFDNYEINLTLYGTGGSYDPEEGSIIIQTTTDGKFKQYENPANTIMHEVTHIGIEASIINKYQVPHVVKERIVDKFVYFKFNKELPAYVIQNMGDDRIDAYLKNSKDLERLNLLVADFMEGAESED